MTGKKTLAAAIALSALCVAGEARGADLRIAIVQAQAGDARKYQPLLEYLSTKGVKASFVTAPDHRAAADLFAGGSVDAMFGGSGLAGTLIVKGLATPLLGAVAANGHGTYKAVVLAPRGGPRFTGTGAFFDGKRVIFAALASAGEFYFRSLGPSSPKAIMKAASHGAAIDALARGQADVAIVKNHTWEKEQAKYPSLEKLGEDSGEHPDGGLVVSRRFGAAQTNEVAAALLALGGDASPGASAAKSALGITGYVPATDKDFAHTLALLKRAGVTKDFAFRF